MAKRHTSSLSEYSLLQAELPTARYKIDLALFNSGQGMSAEFLRLALAGIAVVGTLLTLAAKSSLDDSPFKLLISFSVIAFAMCVGASLLHRFYASSAMFHHVKAMKIAALGDPTAKRSAEIEISRRLSQHNRAHTMLISAATFFVLGAIVLGGAFIRLLFV